VSGGPVSTRGRGSAVEVRDAVKRFGAVCALDQVSFEVEEGSVLGLLGPNGAGKTTLLRILTTLLRPDAGRVRVAGYDVVCDGRKVRSIIGLAGQSATVDDLLTGRENLELVGLWCHLPKREYRRRSQATLERLSLSADADRLVKTYSGGMRRRLDLGASFMADAPVLFLDEPTTGLDPRTRNELWDLIGERVGTGATVVLTTQNMEEAEHLADKIVVIDRGKVIADGTVDQLERRTGGSTLEVRVTQRADLGRAGALLAAVSKGAPRSDPDQRRLSISAGEGTDLLLDVGRRFKEAGIQLEDLGIRRPTLDEAFLLLTDHGDEAAGRKATSDTAVAR
jgi:ABC-2 type transport system ATP-binding protein